VPTPRIMAAAVYAKGIFYRGDLVTEFVPQAVDLVEALFNARRRGAAGAGERLDALRASGALLRLMARAAWALDDAESARAAALEGLELVSHLEDSDLEQALREVLERIER